MKKGQLWTECRLSGEPTVRLLFKFPRYPATMAEKTIRSSDQAVSVQLTESDIPGTFLSEPMASHTVLTGDANLASS